MIKTTDIVVNHFPPNITWCDNTNAVHSIQDKIRSFSTIFGPARRKREIHLRYAMETNIWVSNFFHKDQHVKFIASIEVVLHFLG